MSAPAFAGRTALVTGASGGIGSATAIKLASLGATVLAFGRDTAKLQLVCDEAAACQDVQAAGGSVKLFACDVTCEKSIKEVLASALPESGKLDVLVNNAGVLIGSPMPKTTTETFDTNFNVNTRGVFLMMRECTPALIAAKGNIVNVSSVTGMQSFANSMAYCASKAATDMMTKCAALDLAADGVRVNSVNPGVVRTELQRRGGMTDENYAAFLERSKVTHPLGRVAEPSEVADVIAFISDNTKASFITGAILPIDGGRVCLGAR